MGGRGSSSGSPGRSRITVPDGKRRRGSGSRRKKIKTEPGNPTGDGLPLRPAGGTTRESE
jgi:hypothetical protein